MSFLDFNGKENEMKNEAKCRFNAETNKYEVLYRGFSYVKLRMTDGWEKIGEFESREDAEKMRAGCLDFD